MATRKKRKSRRASAEPSSALSNVIETGQHIWLAGLGAIARTQREGPKLFEDLVTEGSEFQEHQRENLQERSAELMTALRSKLDAGTAGMRGKATETMDNLEEILQTRVLKAMQQLGVPTSREIDALSRKVNELTRSVQALTRSRASGTRTSGTRATAGAGRRGHSASSGNQGAAV